MSYHYSVHTHEPTDSQTMLTYDWFIVDSFTDLDKARKCFRQTWMESPEFDVRLVKAFYINLGEERVSEWLDFKKKTW